MTTDARFLSREQHYAAEADRRDRVYYRNPVIIPGDHGRADVANGKRGRWQRYNNPDSLVWVENIEGRLVALTRHQADVYGEVRRLAGTGIRVTMRSLATDLGVAASTVYRACVRLQALALIAYQSNRGRLGGSVFLLRASRDGLDWCRDAAKETLRRWYKAAEARVSRLRLNVALQHPTRERELYQYPYTVTVTERNIYHDWTPDDFREAGLM